MKYCKRCGENKTLTSFYRRKTCKDGYSTVCKDCEKTSQRERDQAKKQTTQTVCVTTDTYIDQQLLKFKHCKNTGQYEKCVKISELICKLTKEFAIEKRLERSQIAIFDKSALHFKKESEYINMVKDQTNYVVIETNQVPFRTDNVDKIHVLQRRDKIKVLIDLEGFAFDEDIKARMIEKITAQVSS